jgi:hypothetical protein
MLIAGMVVFSVSMSLFDGVDLGAWPRSRRGG